MATSPQPADPPLSLEPVLGWRLWRLERVGGVPTLRSVTRSDLWQPREVMEATCPHRGLTAVCRCGLYAAASPQDLAQTGMANPETCVVGAIAMWGTVVEHTRGARSRYAYPARLRLVCGTCLAAGAGAVDPVVVTDAGDGMTAACLRHAPHAPYATSEPASQVESQLLSAYGVDVMPIERLPLEGRSGPGRLVPPPGRVGVTLFAGILGIIKFLVGLWIASVVIGLGLTIVGAVIGGVVHVFGGEAAAPTPVVTAPPPSHWIPTWRPRAPAGPVTTDLPKLDAKHHLVTPGFPPFALLCGTGWGTQIDVVSCKVDGADLFGWAERGPPNGPKKDCIGRWDAYAHGRRFWICWTDFFGEFDIERWVHSPNPWSIPVDEGGAEHEHR